MKFRDSREMKHTKIEIIPMIDTMFFLLVFFVLASLNIIDLRGLNMVLPDADNGHAQQKIDPKDVKLEIAIDANGDKTVKGDRGRSVRVSKDKSATEALLKEITQQLGVVPTPTQIADVTVVIAPEADTWHQWVISAVDDARGARIDKFTIR